MNKLALLLMLAFALGLAGCAVVDTNDRSAEVVVAPPQALYEYPGMPPAYDYVWIAGYWRWSGSRYAWVPGYWSQPRPGYYWSPFVWERVGPNWRQRGGRWERDPGFPPGSAPLPPVRSEPRPATPPPMRSVDVYAPRPPAPAVHPPAPRTAPTGAVPPPRANGMPGAGHEKPQASTAGRPEEVRRPPPGQSHPDRTRPADDRGRARDKPSNDGQGR